MIRQQLRRLRAALGGGKLDPEQINHLARDGDMDVRAELAGRGDLRPEVLYFLAGDADPVVRRRVAINPATPRQADLLLARDGDVEVRADLAGKIAPMAPGLTATETDPIRRLTYQVLDILVRDQIPRVRRIIAETLKDVANAPPDVIARLARDSDPTVAGPVLQFSPMLDDDELLAIVCGGLASESLGAVGRRRGLSEAVADAVAASKDVEAIAELLGNPSAQLREEALDRLIAKAPTVVAWHEPLVRRPRLPRGAIQKLARFVADTLLKILLDRSDLDEKTRQAVTDEVHRRIDMGATDGTEAAAATVADDPATVRRMFAAGQLTDAAVEKIVRAGKVPVATEALALRAGLEVLLVRKVLANRSAKGVVSLCWKAGVAMSLAIEVQRRLARITPGDVLFGRNGSAYPLSEDEMTWQLEFFADLAREGRA